MNPRLLQSQIHADFSTGSGVWVDYRTDVNGLFLSGFDTNFSDYRDHLIREYNRKINNLNQPMDCLLNLTMRVSGLLEMRAAICLMATRTV